MAAPTATTSFTVWLIPLPTAFQELDPIKSLYRRRWRPVYEVIWSSLRSKRWRLYVESVSVGTWRRTHGTPLVHQYLSSKPEFVPTDRTEGPQWTFTLTCNTTWPILVKFGVGDLHANPPSKYELHAHRCNESHTVLNAQVKGHLTFYIVTNKNALIKYNKNAQIKYNKMP